MTVGLEAVRALVAGVIGKACWSVMASERTDYVIVLDLGEKIRRSLRLANPRLSFLQRTYEGEYSFLVECTWRLDGPRGVAVSCWDPNGLGGTMMGGLSELEGRTVTDVAVDHAGFDLTLHFDEGWTLRCLSTETDLKHKRGNWSFWAPDGLVSIGPRGKVETASHAEAHGRLLALKRKLAEDEDGPLALPRGRGASKGPPAPVGPPESPAAPDDDPPVTIIDDE
ncbi:hypothetical protein L6R52_03500 [Myxococcota bacterium]|nr:hypothetical protein [Myxococcota bacterium]